MSAAPKTSPGDEDMTLARAKAVCLTHGLVTLPDAEERALREANAGYVETLHDRAETILALEQRVAELEAAAEATGYDRETVHVYLARGARDHGEARLGEAYRSDARAAFDGFGPYLDRGGR